MPSLRTQKSDIAALLAKGGLGAIPYAGSLLAEVIGAVIPNQRTDRIVKFAEKLELRLSKIEKRYIDSQLANDEFIGVLEEGIIQASRSTSDDRRDYIASLIANSLSDKDIQYLETRRMMTLLDELNDAEIIILRAHLVRTIGGDEEFREKHKGIIAPPHPVIAAPQSEHDKAYIYQNYKEHLISLGLLKNEYEVNRELGIMEMDTFSNTPKVRSVDLTGMGRLLLRHIGFSEAEIKRSVNKKQ